MHITQLEVENIKRIKFARITPTGSVVQITGDNGAGKSTILDSIVWVLTGAPPKGTVPIRTGQQMGRITLKMGDLIATRRFKGDKTNVVLEAASGAQWKRPQEALDDLYSELTLDPVAFLRASPKEQVEMLRRVLGVDFSELDARRQKAYTMRTEWNARARSFEERMKTVAEGLEPNMNVELSDVSALIDQMAKATDHNSSIVLVRESRARRRAEINNTISEIHRRRDEIARLTAELEGLENAYNIARNKLDDEESMPPVAAPIDISELRAQIAEAQRANSVKEQQLRTRQQYEAAVKELAETKAKSEHLTAHIDAIDEEKRAAIAAKDFPVEGLTLGEDAVFLDGLPLKQASTARQLEISGEIVMAEQPRDPSKPRLKIIMFRDASLFDSHTLARFVERAEAKGYHVWMEKVKTDGKVGILLEEGEVVAIDGQPVESDVDVDVAAFAVDG